MDLRKERERAIMLHDSLDHIRRVANAARCPTRRLDWIAERARRALEGIEYDPFDMPQYPKARKNNTNCRTCHNFDSRPWRCSLTTDGVVCTNGDRYVPADPVRLYENAALAADAEERPCPVDSATRARIDAACAKDGVE